MTQRLCTTRRISLLLLCLSAWLLTQSLLHSRSSVAAQSVTPIHTIQGSGTTSPLAGQAVTTAGIVTAIKPGSSGGFFIQVPEAEADSDPNTSEGLFVFTGSSLPSAAAVGNRVQVTGTVQEFRPSADPVSPTLTELSGTLAVTLISTGNPLPAPVTLTATDTNPAGALEQLEPFEGMRVRVASLTVVAPTEGNVNEANATASSNGIFFGVITGLARPRREPGIEVPDPLPPGAPCCIPRFDANPERLRVDSNALSGAPLLEVTAGATLTNLVGPLDYGSRNWTILPDPPSVTPTPTVSGNIPATPVTAPAADEFTVASFNLERFYDTVNDPGTSDAVLTQTAFNNRLSKASLAIRNVMRAPDIIGVEEVENLTTLQAIAGRINNDAVAAGAASPDYQAYLIEGNDPGGIDVGFLVKASRVNAVEVTQIGKDATYINPNNGQPELLNDRPPLALRATINAPAGSPFAITVIVNHLRSLNGIDDATDGNRVRTKRRAQAEYLANLVQSRQTGNPNERIVVVGDFNAFQFNDGYVDVIGTIKGAPTATSEVTLASSDLVNPDLTDLVETIPASERYSYNFNGSAQVLDHVLVTANLLTRVRRFEYARNDADFPETYRNDPNRPERISDHDMPVATFAFSGTAANVSAASYSAARLAPESIAAVFGAGLATTTEIAPGIPLPTTLGGTTVKVKDSQGTERLAPLFFVSPVQINYLIPADTAAGTATVTITSSDGSVSSGTMEIANVAPGVFAANADGQGAAAALVYRVKADGSQGYEAATRFDAAQNKVVAVPIDPGPPSDQVFLVLFGTGWRKHIAAAPVTIGGTNVQADYAGPQGFFIGLDQLNVLIPRSLAGRGEVDVIAEMDGQKANPVKINIR
ncbi:MAG TPA: endonuclease/exonuclease/phosphatase family protein [Blastocatellia bacterium]|nr:endonuclease/exonuclease/phosphatase family protein [Blastocatellia bacterium]